MARTESSDVVEFGPFRLYLRHRKLFCGHDEVGLGGRATDVLLALASRKGEVVTKEQLFEVVAGHPLPELGTVIGRDSEIAELRETLAHNRLTTIVGAGGMGKTTVAVAAAQLFEDEGGGSITFVDLARVASEEFVTSSLAAALGISADSHDSLHAIVSILARRKTVLLLDTCEHVLNVVAHICDVLLAKTREVRILATSRQVLRVRQEKVVWLAPLSVPPRDHADTASDVLRYFAPQLFAARAFETAGYRITDTDARAIGDICRRLDGAPLAIELVSSRLAGRSADVVLEELDDRFRNLRRDTSDGPLRQQTLLVTLEWSYALLTRTEAAVLRAISIFAGSFDTESVFRVVAHHGLAPSDAFDAIAGLRAKSMLSVDQARGELQYRLLDSTRAFAASLLESYGELEAISASHARFQLEILTRAAAEHATMPTRQWYATYATQADDVRKALEWSLHRSKDPVLGIALAAAGLPLWRELSLAVESHRHCERALIEFDRIGYTDAALRLKLIVGLATSTIYLAADPPKTVALFETALQLARTSADAHAECHILGALAMYPLVPGRSSAISETLQEMRQAALRTTDRSALWEQEHLCAEWDTLHCDFLAARSRLERICAEMRDVAAGPVARFHIHQKTRAELLLGALQFFMGQPRTALTAIEKVARDALDTRHGLTLIHCLAHGIIWIMIECHDYEKAQYYADILRDAVYRHGMAAWIPIADCYEEAVAALSGSRRSPEGLRSAFSNLQNGLTQIGFHSYYANLASAMIAIGQAEDAARIVNFIFHVGPQRWILPEFLRLRAATERLSGRRDDAKATLQESLRAAGEVGILPWKLRSAYDLAILLKDEGARAAARQILAPVYEQFTDGFASGDLRDSRTLLKQLR